MKKLLTLLILVALSFSFSSCEKEGTKTYDLSIQLVYPEASEFTAIAGVTINVTNTTDGTIYTATTDATGLATVKLIAGAYNLSASETRSNEGTVTAFNGSKNNVIITSTWATDGTVQNIDLVASEAKQLIIKEFRFGGCLKDDGSGKFFNDKYVTIYNNSEFEVSLKNLCLAMANPFNSAMATNYDIVDGKLWFEDEGISLCCYGFWSLGENGPTLKGGEELTIVVNGAIDHTKTYKNSVDLSDSKYYVCYDPEAGLTMPSYYPAPSESIPSTQYLKIFWWGQGSAWPMSNDSPAFFIFTPKDGETPQSILASTSNEHQYNNKTGAPNKRKKIQNSWIFDGIEIFKAGADNNKKRLSSAIDGGFLNFTNAQGYTAYRNVDKARTEAIEGNKEKLVYNYAGGTEKSTDPSGIDAEASLKNGAIIFFMDTNNSTNDFHQRKVSALKK